MFLNFVRSQILSRLTTLWCFILILGGFYYRHNCYYHSFFPVSAITYNYIQINKACVFLQSWEFEVYQLIKTANCHIGLSYKIIETDLKKLFHEFCRILNWFCLLCHILHDKNTNYMQHFLIQIYSFQLILLTGACRKSQIWWSDT